MKMGRWTEAVEAVAAANGVNVFHEELKDSMAVAILADAIESATGQDLGAPPDWGQGNTTDASEKRSANEQDS
jgi:hypothetical protein